MRKLMIGVAAAAFLAGPAMAQQQGSRPAGPPPGGPRGMPSADEIFARMDTNKDGVISRAEFNAAHAKMGQRMAERRERRMERRQQPQQ